jgi:hypothetical protein
MVVIDDEAPPTVVWKSLFSSSFPSVASSDDVAGVASAPSPNQPPASTNITTSVPSAPGERYGDPDGTQSVAASGTGSGDPDAAIPETASAPTAAPVNVNNNNNNGGNGLWDWWFVPFAVLVALLISFVTLYAVEKSLPEKTCPNTREQHLSSLDPKEVGRWETVIPEDNGAAEFDQLGMQSVHAILLPSGKVLLTPGSSWRNDKSKTDVFPDTPLEDLKAGKGLYNKEEDPFKYEKMRDYYNTVNNCATYNPASNEFFRVPHPVPVNDTSPNDGRFVPTDLFCSGHLQLPDGNPLFVGGTQFYLPHFSGHHATYIYDWIHDAERDWTTFDWTVMPENQTTEAEDSDTPWFFAGLMKRGRWYPSIVPLMDGRFVIIGGFVDFEDLALDGMYKFEVNQLIEFFDYRRFDGTNTSAAWRHSDVSGSKDSPFQTSLPLEDREGAANCTRCDDGDENCRRECGAHKNDTFKLYPRVALMPDSRRIFFTRDGDFNSMRDPTAMHMRNTKFTYIMDVGTDFDEPQISFARGPDLPRHTLNAGSVIRDPNDNMRLLVSGGMKNSGGFYAPGMMEADDPLATFNGTRYNKLANHYLGGRGSRGVLRYNMPSDEDGIGTWDDEDKDFLGPSANSERTMHYKVILPNRQVLVVGGGNYWFGHSVPHPVLYTSSSSSSDKGGYDAGKLMAPYTGERLYHNTALLLADGRVFMAGGNANRASLDTDQEIALPRDNSTVGQRKFNPRSVERDLYFLADGRMARGHRPSLAEEWTAEIYSPPYMFIDGTRRTMIDELHKSPTGDIVSAVINNKRHYLLHSNMTIVLELSDIPGPELCEIEEGYLTLVKLGSATHGWDSGQQLFNITITPGSATRETASKGSLEFKAPDSQTMQIVPAFYHLFYVDCRGKPTVAQSVRFDDNAESVREPAKPP